VDYSFQVYDNYQQTGQLGYNELFGYINLVSVGLSTVSGGLIKTAIVETQKLQYHINPTMELL
jgi:hypothetical protein